MNEFTVRGATESDINAIMEIENASFPDPWSEHTVRTMLKITQLHLAVLCGEKTVGYAFIGISADEAELYNIAISDEMRGTGAASLLLDKALSELKARNVTKLYLEVREHNGRARSFYVKNGFTEIGIRKNYYESPTENAVLMTLDLN